MRIIPKLARLINFIVQRRMVAFWTMVVVALPAPWVVTSCSTVQHTAGQGRYDNCQVLNVYDGDTMTVSCQGEKIKVRLYCIDAPELGQEPWGLEARDYLRSITGPVVRLEVKDKDRYGRTVAVAWSDNELVNLRMVQAGQAVVYEKYCADRSYHQSEQQVSQKQVGVWGQSGLHQQPWAWRRNYR